MLLSLLLHYIIGKRVLLIFELKLCNHRHHPFQIHSGAYCGK
nr:MAG TPA: hypothetical protein [Caudoviricetes sp.]